MHSEPYYYFEYDHLGTKRPRRTRWKMTIAWAAEHYPGYRPLLWSAEVRQDLMGDPAAFKPYGTDPTNFPNHPGFDPLKHQKKPPD